ncbi:MAG TPA: PIG-L family deacetylase [Iamia sp.]
MASEEWAGLGPGDVVLVVAPHFDDAALSAFALLALRATVLTVCTGRPDPPQRTRWDRRCGFRDSSEAMAARRREDDAALLALGVVRREVGLLDAQYVPARTEEDAALLVGAVAAWQTEHPGGAVALPAGSGMRPSLVARVRRRIPHRRLGVACASAPHPDHVWVGDQLVRAASNAGLVVYEDLPYAWSAPAGPRARALSARAGRTSVPFTLSVERDRKALAVAAYHSQLRGILPRWVRSPAEALADEEHYWHLVPAGGSGGGRRPT